MQWDIAALSRSATIGKMRSAGQQPTSRSESSKAKGRRTCRYNVSKNAKGDSQWICLAALVLSSSEHSG